MSYGEGDRTEAAITDLWNGDGNAYHLHVFGMVNCNVHACISVGPDVGCSSAIVGGSWNRSRR